MYIMLRGSRNSAVGIATGHGMGDQGVGVRVPVGSRIFFSARRPDWLWSSPRLLCNGYRGALSWGVKRAGREADHSSPTSAEVKKTWIYTSTRLYGVVLNELSTGTTLPLLYMSKRAWVYEFP
jgi:hypothetical protein